jgi:hypothetical protein
VRGTLLESPSKRAVKRAEVNDLEISKTWYKMANYVESFLMTPGTDFSDDAEDDPSK